MLQWLALSHPPLKQMLVNSLEHFEMPFCGLLLSEIFLLAIDPFIWPIVTCQFLCVRTAVVTTFDFPLFLQKTFRQWRKFAFSSVDSRSFVGHRFCHQIPWLIHPVRRHRRSRSWCRRITSFIDSTDSRQMDLFDAGEMCQYPSQNPSVFFLRNSSEMMVVSLLTEKWIFSIHKIYKNLYIYT